MIIDYLPAQPFQLDFRSGFARLVSQTSQPAHSGGPAVDEEH
jgi:hypothetical protein